MTAQPQTSLDWWASLRHAGLMLSRGQIAALVPDTPKPLDRWLSDRLRRDLGRFAADGKNLSSLLDLILEDVCGLDGRTGGAWKKGSNVETSWSHRAITGETIRPSRIFLGPHGEALPLFETKEPRLGIGRGVREVARVIEWLRLADRKIAIATNGRQLRLIYAGLDHDAWAEWDTDLWFEQGKPSAQVDALRALLSGRTLVSPSKDELPPLVNAILETRKGQAEVSSALGENVRRAVEKLIRAHASALDELGDTIQPNDIYIAAVRIIMRMVVVLFAEARGLLPRDNPIYDESYGLQGLRAQLDRAASGKSERLRARFAAWPRILALFRLVHEGSSHEAVPIPRYGGELFRPGAEDQEEGIGRALALFESACYKSEHEVADAVVDEILRLLTVTEERVRQGRGVTRAKLPVNFADLSTEYIGMLYEGLLNYELRRADEAIVFVAVGDEPALPLARVEKMDEKALAGLTSKFKKPKAEESDDEEDESEEEDTDEAEEDPEEIEAAEGEDEESDDADHMVIRERAEKWAAKAVEAGKVVKRPRSSNRAALEQYREDVKKAARGLVREVVEEGKWYLVRSGGTRKGAGTFYTRPQLAVPTVHRTLRLLAFDAPKGKDGKPDEMAAPSAWTPKKPEEILGLKVCDPACGSGSFLVGALRFLTDALYVSLHHHERIRENGPVSLITLAEGKASSGALSDETLPSRPDDPLFEARLKSRLKRYVVERCIYGVDFDPVAVELARLALWIETMDKELPFEFIDHKIKLGNALVGCWFDYVKGYPVFAWKREGGDKDHKQFVHHWREKKSGREKTKSGDKWTEEIKVYEKELVRPRMRDWLSGQKGLHDALLPDDAEKQHAEAARLFEELHALPIHESEARAEFYRTKIAGSESYRKLRDAFDTWCALWFWPPDELDAAPLPAGKVTRSNSTLEIAREVARQWRFFHWELEFPDVFTGHRSGFDAILGNPPWETSKPNSKEFFSNLDPLYRSYGKQDALAVQKKLFERSGRDEQRWIEYCYAYKAMSNWVSRAGSPFGDGVNGGEILPASGLGEGLTRPQAEWLLAQIGKKRGGVKGYADPEHPFRHQGSADINLYKLFLEQSAALLRQGGRLGMIVPSGIYSDKGTSALRELFLEHYRWHWLFGFENRAKIFDIHRSFKFNPVIVEKGGTTEEVATAFMHRDLRDWEDAERHSLSYPKMQIVRFSPSTRAIVEIQNPRDLVILEGIYERCARLGDENEGGWGVRYGAEFHMTADSKLFPPRPKWEEKGYKPDNHGRWIHPNGDVAVPLYEGRMIGQFDFSQKGWVSGKGRAAKWREIPFEAKVIEPQFLMSKVTYQEERGHAETHFKVGMMDVTSATNTRTVIATALGHWPTGHKVPTLTPCPYSASRVLATTSILNSFVFDYLIRCRLGGQSLIWGVLEETPVPSSLNEFESLLAQLAARLSMPHVAFAGLWPRLREGRNLSWRSHWAITPHERLRIRLLIEALVAFAYGLSANEYAYILRDCDVDPVSLRSTSRDFDSKGFWRVDKQLEPEQRLSVLSQIVFQELTAEVGTHPTPKAVCSAIHAAEKTWQIPKSISLTDYNLGRGVARSFPLRSSLGPRLLPMQSEDVESSWRECERHARRIGKNA